MIIALCASGCTTNDGDIGPFFGEWSLEELMIEGHTDDSYVAGTTFFAFQTRIVQVTVIHPHNSTDQVTGTWFATSDSLTLDFSHSDDNSEASEGVYAPPSWIYITEPVTEFSISWIGKNTLLLANGKYTYILKKI